MNFVQDKTIVITGASRGIGEAAARHFAANGGKVVLAARSEDQVARIADEIAASGGKAIGIACNVADFSSVQSMIDRTSDTFGPADVLINNAGVIDPIARIDESDPALWSSVVDINLKGVYYAARAVLPVMAKRGSGTIINLSSGAATSALEGWSHYCATKAAVLMLTKMIDKEYGPLGIRAVGISPGTVATDMQVQIKASGINPVSQLDPGVHIPTEWVAKALLWLCGDDAAPYAGGDFSLKTEEGRAAAGLPPL